MMRTSSSSVCSSSRPSSSSSLSTDALLGGGEMSTEDAEALVESVSPINGRALTNGPEKLNGNGLTTADGILADLKDGDVITYRPESGWELTRKDPISGVPTTSHLLDNGIKKAPRKGWWSRLRGR